jgi:hypothetical protein
MTTHQAGDTDHHSSKHHFSNAQSSCHHDGLMELHTPNEQAEVRKVTEKLKNTSLNSSSSCCSSQQSSSAQVFPTPTSSRPITSSISHPSTQPRSALRTIHSLAESHKNASAGGHVSSRQAPLLRSLDELLAASAAAGPNDVLNLPLAQIGFRRLRDAEASSWVEKPIRVRKRVKKRRVDGEQRERDIERMRAGDAATQAV